jgi:hypothetical protein
VNGAASASSDPSSSTNCVLFAFDAADTNLQVMHNDGAGGCTKIDLGANFPRPTVESTLYKARLWSAPGGTSIKWRIQRLDDPTKVASGTISTELLAADAELYAHFYVNNGPTTSVAAAIDFVQFYCETPKY